MAYKTTISFGVVSIPVKINNAVNDGKKFQGKFHQTCAECGSRIKSPKICPDCSNDKMQKAIKHTKKAEIGNLHIDDWTLGKEDLQRVFEVGKSYVEIHEEDMENLPLSTIKEITILHFAERKELDELAFDTPYYLSVDEEEGRKGGKKSYNLLVKAMEKTGKVAIAKHTIRDREHLCFLTIKNGVLVMHTFHYKDDVYEPDKHRPEETPFTENELKLAVGLINTMSEKFEWDQYQDEYHKALIDMIERKIANPNDALPAQALPDHVPTDDADLINALTKSLEKEKVRVRR